MLNVTFLIPLVENLGLLAALAVGYAGVLTASERWRPTARSIAIGAVFGAAGAVAMHLPVELLPGLIFDVRAVPLLLSAVFGGPWAAVVAGAEIAGVRLMIGGTGAVPAMVTVIGCICFSISLWHLRQRYSQFGAHHLAVAGLLSIIPISLGLSLLGFDAAKSILAAMAFPLIVTHTLGCYLVGWLLLAEDRRRRTEWELQQARQAADRANEAKSQFLAQISHELRTPMSAIIGSLDILSLEAMKAEHRQMVEVTRRSANNLVALLNDLLDLSKIEAGQMTFSEQAVDIRALLDDQRTLYSSVADSKGLPLTFKIAANVPQHIRIDGHRLKQVLGNLLGNAIKFTAEGFVEVTAEMAADTGKSPRMRIAVRDTGAGIPAHRQEAIFEAFAQANAQIDHLYGGTGLGLPISRKLARAMGGDVTLESIEKLGSCFVLELPVETVEVDDLATVETQAETDLATLVSTKPFANRRVLLAEDVEVSRAVIAEMLQSLGADVVAVSDGEQAVIEAMKGVDLILMDMQMPLLDGQEATRRIRQLSTEVARTPIFALTADATVDNKRLYHAAGLDGVLTKPVDWGQLVAAVGCYMCSANPSENASAPLASKTSSFSARPCRAVSQPSPSTQAATSCNAETLHSLEEILGRDTLLDLLQQFPVSIDLSLEEVRKAVSEVPLSHDRLRMAAHSLKGAAANLGFERFHDLAEKLETSAERDEAALIAGELEDELQQVRAFIDDYTHKQRNPTAISAVL